MANRVDQSSQLRMKALSFAVGYVAQTEWHDWLFVYDIKCGGNKETRMFAEENDI